MVSEARPEMRAEAPVEPFELTACQAADAIAAGHLTSEALVESCLARIAAREDTVQAWAFLDPDYALEQARAADAQRRSGEPIGPLHGLPVGLKDIVDTRDMPTENGTVLDAGRRPEHDATIVSLLRQAGAIPMGKTVTTELAFFNPGKTRNPVDAGRTPGGSSSGSAAAVADRMVPLAIGSQTYGSVIRPASFCGVVGFKPSYGLIPRSGVLALAPSLDTIGAFARTVDDAALLCDALAGYDPGDPATEPRARPQILKTARTEPPASPRLAFVKSPHWPKADADARAGFDELAEALGETCEEIELPEIFGQAHDQLQKLASAEMAKGLRRYEQRGGDQLSQSLRDQLASGRAVSATEYMTARDGQEILNAGLDAIFDQYDAILTTSARGQAPVELKSTGDPVFSVLWTYCGVPAMNLPLLVGADGLPIGVQLVGRKFDDARLARTANWLVRELAS